MLSFCDFSFFFSLPSLFLLLSLFFRHSLSLSATRPFSLSGAIKQRLQSDFSLRSDSSIKYIPDSWFLER